VPSALAARTFLAATQSQLTYHGLFTLATMLSPGALVALFRGAHLAVLHRPPDANGIYTLTTDQVFLHEPSVVWERLADVDQNASTFVDSYFVPSTPVGGDWAGQTVEHALGEESSGDAFIDSAEYVYIRSLFGSRIPGSVAESASCVF
jgi:ubiquitin carboxyl-terminal hydrolase MINDY-1/2